MEFGSTPYEPMSRSGLKEERACPAPQHTDRNLAARMGRWSASHWKTATFGWLAFVLVAFGLGGTVGTKNIASSAGPGESGRMDRILEAGFEQPASERVLDPEPVATCRHDRLRCGDRGCRRARSRKSRTSATSARRSSPETRPTDRRTGTPHWSSSRSAATRRRRSTRSVPSWTRVAACATCPSGLHDRRVRRRERREGGRGLLRRGPRQGRHALASDHADRARAHFRLARRGRHSALARADRRVRDLRPRCALERSAAGRDAGPGDGAPDRARRRRRLLAVLLEARTARTRGGAQRAGGARGRGRDLRPLGAHLGPDRDGGDGRHVPDRRLDLRVARRWPRSSSSPSRCSGR